MLLNELIDVKIALPNALEDFLPLAMEELQLKKLPNIRLVKFIRTADQSSFGRFNPADCSIELGVSNRHPIDILRTLAHELVHCKQHLNGEIKYDSGETGSREENHANSTAGIIMRKFNKKYPQYFNSVVLITEARGLFAREEGDEFKDNTTGEIFKFKNIERYPPTSGSYATEKERDKIADPIIQQLNPIIVNSKSNTLLSFAVATFETNEGNVRHYLKYFTDVSGDMYGKWLPKNIPGLTSTGKASQKKQASLAPQELLSKRTDIDSKDSTSTGNNSKTNANKVDGHKFINEQALVGTLMTIPDDKLDPSIKNVLKTFSSLPIIFDLPDGVPGEAVSDNLGEIVQALAFTRNLIDTGDANRAKKAVFGRNANWSQLGIEFPSGQTAGLIDFVLYKNNKRLKVSSKSEKGAYASLKNLWNTYNKLSGDEKIDFDKKYKDTVEILKIIVTGGDHESKRLSSSVEAPLAIGVSKGLLKEEQAEEVRKLLTMSNKQAESTMSKWAKKTAETIKIKASTTKWNWGYRLLNAVAKMVAEEVNKNDKVSDGLLELLNKSAILQVHSKITKSKNQVKFTDFEVKYPAVFEGKILVTHEKTYVSTERPKGRYTFKFK